MDIKSKFDTNNEYKTEKQWNKQNRIVNQGEVGRRMWCNGFCHQVAEYFLKEQTHSATTEELKILKDNRRLIQKRYLDNAKARREEVIRELVSKAWECKLDAEIGKHQVFEYQARLNMLSFIIENIPIKKSIIPSETIVLDLETTGLSSSYDEILQIAIIDIDGNELLNTYVCPYFHDRWDDAEGIHGIKPQMVSNAPYLHEVISDVKSIMDSARTIIGYNPMFDLEFLKNIGIDYADKEIWDVMSEFAQIYGEWDDYYQEYKFKSLEACANYFNYAFNAHNALDDVKATLHCYNAIKTLNMEDKNGKAI